MLKETTLFDTIDRVAMSIGRLQDMEPPDGYWLAFSGGKDSITCHRLCEMAGVKFDAHYSVTTVDPPELIYFIRKHYPDVKFHHPDNSMWELIGDIELMPPLRQQRWCCRQLKETGGAGRRVITGIRWAAWSLTKAGRRIGYHIGKCTFPLPKIPTPLPSAIFHVSFHETEITKDRKTHCECFERRDKGDQNLDIMNFFKERGQ